MKNSLTNLKSNLFYKIELGIDCAFNEVFNELTNKLGYRRVITKKHILEAFEAADVILAKGMGNNETLYGCGYNVYYAFLVKCQFFVERFGKPLMTPMLVAERK